MLLFSPAELGDPPLSSGVAPLVEVPHRCWCLLHQPIQPLSQPCIATHPSGLP